MYNGREIVFLFLCHAVGSIVFAFGTLTMPRMRLVVFGSARTASGGSSPPAEPSDGVLWVKVVERCGNRREYRDSAIRCR